MGIFYRIFWKIYVTTQSKIVPSPSNIITYTDSKVDFNCGPSIFDKVRTRMTNATLGIRHSGAVVFFRFQLGLLAMCWRCSCTTLTIALTITTRQVALNCWFHANFRNRIQNFRICNSHFLGIRHDICILDSHLGPAIKPSKSTYSLMRPVVKSRHKCADDPSILFWYCAEHLLK